MNGEVSSWIPPEIPQPSAKTLEAVDKLASYMKAKAAENPPEPKEPKGPRVRSDDGRFAGVRLNEEEVPRLPIPYEIVVLADYGGSRKCDSD